jgi:hypothetical protein
VHRTKIPYHFVTENIPSPWLERYERLKERELDLKEVCRRGYEELFVVFNCDFPKFRKNL